MFVFRRGGTFQSQIVRRLPRRPLFPDRLLLFNATLRKQFIPNGCFHRKCNNRINSGLYDWPGWLCGKTNNTLFKLVGKLSQLLKFRFSLCSFILYYRLHLVPWRLVEGMDKWTVNCGINVMEG